MLQEQCDHIIYCPKKTLESKGVVLKWRLDNSINGTAADNPDVCSFTCSRRNAPLICKAFPDTSRQGEFPLPPCGPRNLLQSITALTSNFVSYILSELAAWGQGFFFYIHLYIPSFKQCALLWVQSIFAKLTFFITNHCLKYAWRERESKGNLL